MSCQKWAERKNETEALFDIYDGRIWKEFKDDNAEPFFTREYADYSCRPKLFPNSETVSDSKIFPKLFPKLPKPIRNLRNLAKLPKLA